MLAGLLVFGLILILAAILTPARVRDDDVRRARQIRLSNRD